jgi:hypothetical protein
MNNTEEIKTWYELRDGSEVIMTKLMTEAEMKSAAASLPANQDLEWGMRRDYVSVQYSWPPVEIRYSESDNNWTYTLRGKERRAETLANAKKAIDAPLPKDKKAFKQFDAYVHTAFSKGSPLAKVTVTGIVYSKYRRDQVYIKYHNADSGRRRGRNTVCRNTAYISSLLAITPENEAIVAKLEELQTQRNNIEAEMENQGKKLTGIKANLEDYD